MSETTPEELAENAKAKGTFSIVSVLQERAYPTDDIVIYLDEATGYKASVAAERIEEIERELLILPENKELRAELEQLKKDNEKFASKLEESKYVFHITGISEGNREKIYEKSTEKYPVEFSEEKNPFSGETKRTELDNDERDRYFTNLIWQAHIVKIVNNDGAEQDSLSYEDVVVLRSELPISAQGKLNQAIEKIRNATAVFMYSVDEDFLAKS